MPNCDPIVAAGPAMGNHCTLVGERWQWQGCLSRRARRSGRQRGGQFLGAPMVVEVE
jgi:hypothetical protein